MAKLRRHSGTALLSGMAMLLASCATPAAKLPVAAAAPEQLAAPKGSIIPGVVVAIRPVAAPGLSAGSAAVLTALQVALPTQAPNATEFVIQRSDGNVAAIVLPSPSAAPGAAMSAANFSVGDQVELITGPQTELIHRDP